MKVIVSEHIWEFDLAEALTDVSAQRREQALRFRHELGRRQCVLAYRLLQQGLREVYGITERPVFEYGEHGKPAILGRPDIYFSLSHCRHAVACAVGDRPVGIDVEAVREFREPLARYTMNGAELQTIMSATRPDVEFIRLWTMKEALLKMTGEGITNDLKTVLTDSGKCCFSTVESADLRYIYTLCQPR